MGHLPNDHLRHVRGHRSHRPLHLPRSARPPGTSRGAPGRLHRTPAPPPQVHDGPPHPLPARVPRPPRPPPRHRRARRLHVLGGLTYRAGHDPVGDAQHYRYDLSGRSVFGGRSGTRADVHRGAVQCHGRYFGRGDCVGGVDSGERAGNGFGGGGRGVGWWRHRSGRRRGWRRNAGGEEVRVWYADTAAAIEFESGSVVDGFVVSGWEEQWFGR
mmetsp:Transcript_20854/g.43960  ORF Transcript_20854/g.43960 Transcript_20854/m.43960 type:complete len:214 (-) Transcript_20854:162-803(-)